MTLDKPTRRRILCDALVKEFGLEFGAITLKVQDKTLVSVRISRTLKVGGLDEKIVADEDL